MITVRVGVSAAAVAVALMSSTPAAADPDAVGGPVPPAEAVTPGAGFGAYGADGHLVGTCTLGFLATDTAGRHYAITAGHCSGDGNAVMPYQTASNFRRIGLFAHTVDDPADGDIAAIALGDTAPPQDARVLSRRPVTGVTDTVTTNDTLCFYGMRSGGHPHCGRVTSAAASDETHRVDFAVAAVHGDSGSPVYRIEPTGDATAVGTLDSTTGDYSTATLIKPYLKRWGLSLTCQATPNTTERCKF